MPPKGWRKNTPETVVAEEVKEVVSETRTASASVPVAVDDPIASSRKSLEQPLQDGQAFFEAPDGYIAVADAKRDHVWYRAGNGGSGMWINKRRG